MRTYAPMLLVVAVFAMLILAGCPAPAPEQQAVAPEPPVAPEPAVAPEPTAPEPASAPTGKDTDTRAEPAIGTDYDMGDLPEHTSSRLISAFVPPERSARETPQWPAALWSTVGDGKLVVYARHETGYNSLAKKGNFIVWCGPPPQYIEACRRNGGYGDDEAWEYLKLLGVRSVEAEMYIGPGDKSGPAPGYSPWRMGANRCVAMLFQPDNGTTLMKRLTIWANMADDEKVFIYRGPCQCTCPEYPDGKPDGDWIRVSMGGSDYWKVDQWGLPGNTPVPTEHL